MMDAQPQTSLAPLLQQVESFQNTVAKLLETHSALRRENDRVLKLGLRMESLVEDLEKGAMLAREAERKKELQ
ncbi:hypothetical protein BJ508DRAFT_415064 [Ascobolus immersus RN42]|uniref:Uncharacterized protein n=1 Tax=Ascobolus immersus RN42 TaxID=1160509 RepID=A0A3N4I6G7_ASCIM|nr:hypothetical protein BJ508DRAFT_415064 [Ascobolus immersus RN42]